MHQAIFRNRWLPYFLLVPTLLILVLFLYYPILRTFQLSFYKAAPNGLDLTYVGLDNFRRLLDPQIQFGKDNILQVKGDYVIVLLRSLLFSAAIVIGGISISLV